MSSQETTNERHTFTVKDVNVQEFLEGKENKSEYLREMLRSEVYGDSTEPDHVDSQVWDTYMAALSLFGANRHYELGAVVAGISADQNEPSEVVSRRIKRCVSLGLLERHTQISKVTVAAKEREEIGVWEVAEDE
jgi:hypothetical protein